VSGVVSTFRTTWSAGVFLRYCSRSQSSNWLPAKKNWMFEADCGSHWPRVMPAK
jgi:hypothetical protein